MKAAMRCVAEEFGHNNQTTLCKQPAVNADTNNNDNNNNVSRNAYLRQKILILQSSVSCKLIKCKFGSIINLSKHSPWHQIVFQVNAAVYGCYLPA